MMKLKKLKNLIKNKLKIDENKVELLFNKAVEMTQSNVEIYSLTRDIRENFEKEKILEIFSYMWEVVLADGKIDDFELALMTKLTGLFHLTGKKPLRLNRRPQVLFFFSNLFFCFQTAMLNRLTLFLHNLKLEGLSYFS